MTLKETQKFCIRYIDQLNLLTNQYDKNIITTTEYCDCLTFYIRLISSTRLALETINMICPQSLTLIYNLEIDYIKAKVNASYGIINKKEK